MMRYSIVTLLVAFVWPACAAAQAPAATGPAATRPRAWPIVLGPDDKPAFPPPPKGFDVPRDGIPHGKLEGVEYDSRTVGTRRKMLVYTPPGYAPGQTYNVLYLLHGIGGDETEWRRFCAPDVILDNLYADGKLAPMIVCFPNGRAEPDDRPRGDVYRHAKAFENFTGDLLDDVIPFVDARYPVKPGPAHRALAGFSMGGGQSLNIGLRHLDRFAWVGGFSSAPNTHPPAELLPTPPAPGQLQLLYLACGDHDGLLHVSQQFHAYLKEQGIPHVWHVNPGGHNGETWKLDLYHFSQLLFRAPPPAPGDAQGK